MPSRSAARDALIATLRERVASLEGVRLADQEEPISTGSPALDRLLPCRGLRRGTLVEYLSPLPGSGAGLFALSAARHACRDGRAFVVLDAAGLWKRRAAAKPSRRSAKFFYPPAAAAIGLDLDGMLVLRPTNQADALWALDQVLRCPAVGAAWAVCDRLDIRDFRRLQLAAEEGQTLGLLLRSSRQRGHPTWADVRFEVRGMIPSSFGNSSVSPWRLRVELIRCHGGATGQTVFLELNETDAIWREVPGHATYPLPASAQLAYPAAARRA
jgi:protein ImuA